MWADRDGVALVTPAIPMRLDHHRAHSWPWGGSEGGRWDSETAGLGLLASLESAGGRVVRWRRGPPTHRSGANTCSHLKKHMHPRPLSAAVTSLSCGYVHHDVVRVMMLQPRMQVKVDGLRWAQRVPPVSPGKTGVPVLGQAQALPGPGQPCAHHGFGEPSFSFSALLGSPHPSALWAGDIAVCRWPLPASVHARIRGKVLGPASVPPAPQLLC